MKRIIALLLILMANVSFADHASLVLIDQNDLKPYPNIPLGKPTPFEIWKYYGKTGSSFGSPTLPMSFDQWLLMLSKQKPMLMSEVKKYMSSRYDLTQNAIPGKFMSGGKPIMLGPTSRLPKTIKSYEDLATLSPSQIKEQDVFPFKPLAHPLQNIAHMVFPRAWINKHPEHERIDVDMDIPEAYLPEFPPPMYLTTHKELGDVTKGREITFENYYDIFDGLLTAEQMEGLKELLRPTPTTWFNQTSHRVTKKPTYGVACFSCHVNGHTNGAFELAPDSRPNLARLRTKTTT